MSRRPSSVSSRRAADAGWLTSLPLLLNLVSVGSTGYIIRQLGEAGWGTLVTAMGLSGATTILSNLGMRALYTRAVTGADNDETQRLMGEQLALRTMLGILAGALATGAAAWLHPNDPMIVACTAIQAISVLITIMWTVMADILNAREQFMRNAMVAFIAGLVLTAASVTAAATGAGPVTIATTYMAGPATSLALLIMAVRGMGVPIRFGGATWQRYRTLLREARALAANDIWTMLQGRAAGVWAPLLFGKGLIGVNDSGSLPYNRLGSDGIATAYFPAMATAHKRGDEEELRHQVAGMFTLTVLATVPLAIFIWYGAPYLAQLLFPNAQQMESVVLMTFVARVTSAALPITALGTAIRYAMQAVGQYSRNAKDQMIGTTISSVLTFLLAITIGIKGLAVGILCRSIITRTTQQRSFSRRFPAIISEIQWQRPAMAMLALAGAMELLVGTDSRVGLLGAVVAGCAVAGGYVWFVLGSGLVDLKKNG